MPPTCQRLDVADARPKARCRWLTVRGAVRPVVVVVDVPDRHRVDPLGLAAELTCVERFFDQGPLITLDLPVVPRCVGLGLPVPSLVADDTGEVSLSVTGAVVSDHGWMWLMPCAANHAFARARSAAAVTPFSSSNGSV